MFRHFSALQNAFPPFMHTIDIYCGRSIKSRQAKTKVKAAMMWGSDGCLPALVWQHAVLPVDCDLP